MIDLTEWKEKAEAGDLRAIRSKRMEITKADIAEWTERANNGDPQAIWSLGQAYRFSVGGVEENGKMARYLEETAQEFFLANNGEPHRMEQAALAYEKGYGLKRDLEKANKWYEKRIKALTEQAEDGDLEAMWYVARAYEKGLGVKKDKAKADEWDEKTRNAREAELRKARAI